MPRRFDPEMNDFQLFSGRAGLGKCFGEVECAALGLAHKLFPLQKEATALFPWRDSPVELA